MEFEEVVQARRSIRTYKNQKVEEEKIEKLMEMARLCQSAKNRQPWNFMILQGEEKNAVADIMLSLFERNDIEIPGYMNTSKYSTMTIQKAAVLILVLRKPEDIWEYGDLLSIGAAIEHICLETVNLGLGSVWIRDTVYTEKEICTHLGYQDMQLVSGIAVGYPDEQPQPRARKQLKDIILQNRS